MLRQVGAGYATAGLWERRISADGNARRPMGVGGGVGVGVCECSVDVVVGSGLSGRGQCATDAQRESELRAVISMRWIVRGRRRHPGCQCITMAWPLTVVYRTYLETDATQGCGGASLRRWVANRKEELRRPSRRTTRGRARDRQGQGQRYSHSDLQTADGRGKITGARPADEGRLCLCFGWWAERQPARRHSMFTLYPSRPHVTQAARDGRPTTTTTTSTSTSTAIVTTTP
jgi:hypothetical protein